MGRHEPISGRERVSRRRAALRASGLRPRQFWLPDMTDLAHKAEAGRQAALIAASACAAEDQAFVDAIADWAIADSDGLPQP